MTSYREVIMDKISIYERNIAELQEQLHNAQCRIRDLNTELLHHKRPHTNALGIEVSDHTYKITYPKR